MTNERAAEAFREITGRIYALISCPPGRRDFEIIRPLYHPRATLVRTGLGDDGQPFVLAMSFDEYASNVATLLGSIEFTEDEVRQQATVFGNVAQVTSIYRYRYRSPGATRGGLGVNFFNLVNEGQGWKIMNVIWDNERAGVSLRDAGLLDDDPPAAGAP